MKLQNFTVIFVIIALPIILLMSLYISTGLKTIKYQAIYDTGLITATQDAIHAFEINSLKNQYADNAEVKRSIIKASVKMLEQSLCNTCNIPSYNTSEIEEYIPAVLFGMNNGFYLYTPSKDPKTNEYKHSLKNYVYYSEELEGNDDKTKGVVIIYHLDSYIEVSGWFKDGEGNSNYESKEGYLICVDKTFTDVDNITYYDYEIDKKDDLAIQYYKDNKNFSEWFNNTVVGNIKNCNYEYLKINASNDPEDPESDFSKHKKEVIKDKIQNVLNSSITAYSNRTYGQNYKMPKLSEDDWEKIYTDISVLTFFQGKRIGFTKYNGYCVLNSNNHNELINPNLLYFSTDDNGDNEINTTKDYYHDIRCDVLKSVTDIEEAASEVTTLRGWKIGRFEGKTVDLFDASGDKTGTKEAYDRNECACYECINGSVSSSSSVYDYIKATESTTDTKLKFIKNSYWTSLARERAKLQQEKTIQSELKVTLLAKDDEAGEYSTDVILSIGTEVYVKMEIKNNSSTKIEYVTMDITKSLNSINITQYYVKNSEGSKIADFIIPTDKFENISATINPNQTIVIEFRGNKSEINMKAGITVSPSTTEKSFELGNDMNP